MDQTSSSRKRTRAHPPHARVVGLSGRTWPGVAQSLALAGISASGQGLEAVPSPCLLDRFRVRTGGPLRSERLVPETDLLIHGEGIGPTHSARLGALRRGIGQATPSAWLGQTFQARVGVAVAGGPEASAATAMIGWVLVRTGLDPTVLLGRPVPQLGGWARLGAGVHAVAEWPDLPNRLGEAGPGVALLLRVGGDPWFESAAWGRVCRCCLPGLEHCGEVLALGHPSLLESGRAWGPVSDRVGWISWKRGSDWWGSDLRETAAGQRFRVFRRGSFVTEVGLRVHGPVNALGALAAVAVCTGLGVPVGETRAGLEEFGGLSRDFEPRGSFRGVTLIDDAAEEPGLVRGVLDVARRAFGRRRLWVVFSAPEVPGPGLIHHLRDALAGADRVLVTPSKGAESGLAGTPRGGGSWLLARRLVGSGVAARWEADLAGVVAELDRQLEPGDVLLTLGAGDVGTIADAFIRRLPRDRQGG